MRDVIARIKKMPPVIHANPCILKRSGQVTQVTQVTQVVLEVRGGTLLSTFLEQKWAIPRTEMKRLIEQNRFLGEAIES